MFQDISHIILAVLTLSKVTDQPDTDDNTNNMTACLYCFPVSVHAYEVFSHNEHFYKSVIYWSFRNVVVFTNQ